MPELRRPVKWIEDRREHFLAAVQERDQYWDLEAAFENDGPLLGVRGRMIHDQGAYTPQGINLPYNASTALPGPYCCRPTISHVQVVETNKVATMPVRGAGYPEGAFAMERVLDAHRARARSRSRRGAAAQSRAGREDSLRHAAEDALRLVHHPRQRRLSAMPAACARRHRLRRLPRTPGASARVEGRYLGIGIGNGVKGTGRGPFESGIVRIGRSGRISVYTGAMPMGQGIRTALAQICAEQFDVAPDDVTVMAGDTAVIPHGQGGFASRQTVTAGSAVHMAAVAVREKALAVAAHLLEASPEDLEMKDGRIDVAGFRARHHASGGGRGGVRRAGLSDAGQFRAGPGKHAEFHPGRAHLRHRLPRRRGRGRTDTCGVRILRYVVVNDSGRVINPMTPLWSPRSRIYRRIIGANF